MNHPYGRGHLAYLHDYDGSKRTLVNVQGRRITLSDVLSSIRGMREESGSIKNVHT